VPGQSTAASEALLDEAASHILAASHIFPAEIRNVLLILERRRRITTEQARKATSVLSTFGIGIEPAPSSIEYDAILDLARRERLTVYDTTYLWDAMHRGFTLASRDGDLLNAASRVGVSIEDLRDG
jgi:predicted nucleic acid-binding protein